MGQTDSRAAGRHLARIAVDAAVRLALCQASGRRRVPHRAHAAIRRHARQGLALHHVQAGTREGRDRGGRRAATVGVPDPRALGEEAHLDHGACARDARAERDACACRTRARGKGERGWGRGSVRWRSAPPSSATAVDERYQYSQPVCARLSRAQASPKDFVRLHSSMQNILTVHMDSLKKKERTKKGKVAA